MRIMMVGDIYAQPGRKAVCDLIPSLREEFQLDLVIANGENSAGGVGITVNVLEELLNSGIDFVTSGNHIWDKKDIFDFIDQSTCLIRPANYPAGTPGKGFGIIRALTGEAIGIINLAGRVFMPPVDCPFRSADAVLDILSNECKIILVDFHAEATSEKMALGWYLDGRVTCVAGTHTHVQTSDERVLPGGTAFISDIGMVGPHNSVLGVNKDTVINKFLSGLPVKFEVAKGPVVFCAIVIDVNTTTGKTNDIIRVQRYWEAK